MEVKHLASETLEGAFQEINAHALGTRATLSAYHAKICPAQGEHLTEEQALKAVDRLEEELGFNDQPRAVVRHEKHGREHFHVVWSRIDIENMKAIDTPNNYEKHEKVAKELEREFSLSETENRAFSRNDGGERTERNAAKWEYLQAERLGAKGPRAEKKEITKIYNESKNGAELKANLAAAGYTLAKGDKEGVFLVVNEQGGFSSLARRIEGAKKADIVGKLSDLDREALPNLRDAKEIAAVLQNAAQGVLAQGEGSSTKGTEKEYEKTTKNLSSLTKEIAAVDGGGLRVVGCTLNATGRALEKVADVAEGILNFFDPPAPRVITPAEMYKSKEAEKEYAQQLAEKKERNKAIERIAETTRKDKCLRFEDLRALSRTDLEQIRERGDDAIAAMCRRREQELERERGRGLGR